MEESSLYQLELENELRLSVGEQAQGVGLELVSGLAEINGTVMENNKTYLFPQFSSVAVFTWHGCSLKVTGKPTEVIIEKETFKILHVVLHACLEQMRRSADQQNKRGPVTLIVGPKDSGKSTLCKFLLNYAARLDHRPYLIDLDVGQNSLSIPGTINILNVEKPADIVEGFDDSSIQAYHLGCKSPGENLALYFLLIKKLGQVLKSRLREVNKIARSSGVIIDTCGWTRDGGYQAIIIAAMAFEIDKLVVVAENRLYSQLKREMPSCVEVLYMPKMLGVPERSPRVRFHYRAKRVREYFYGSVIPLHPYTFEVKYSDLKVIKIEANNPAQPVSIDVTLNDLHCEDVYLGMHLLNRILALSSADRISEEIITTNIIGFICVINVDLKKKVITVLSPQPEPLPKNILLLSSIKLENQIFLKV